MTTRHALTFAAFLLLTTPALAQGEVDTIPVESFVHTPKHTTPAVLYELLTALAERHGHGIAVKKTDEGVVVRGLSEDVEALSGLVLLVDLPPAKPLEETSLPQLLSWEQDRVWVLPLRAEDEGEHLETWLRRLIGYHPTARSLLVFQLPDVQRIVVIGTPTEIDMASKATEILLEAYRTGFKQGQANPDSR